MLNPVPNEVLQAKRKLVILQDAAEDLTQLLDDLEYRLHVQGNGPEGSCKD